MYVIKKHDSVVPADATAAVNDANEANGVTSVKWRGVNPNFNTGATGNAAAGAGLTYVDVTYTSKGLANVIETMHSVACTKTLLAGQTNYISVSIVRLGYNDPSEIVGISNIWAQDPNPTTGANPTPRLIPIDNLINWHLTDDKISFIIPNANRALVQNKNILFKVNSIARGSL